MWWLAPCVCRDPVCIALQHNSHLTESPTCPNNLFDHFWNEVFPLIMVCLVCFGFLISWICYYNGCCCIKCYKTCRSPGDHALQNNLIVDYIIRLADAKEIVLLQKILNEMEPGARFIDDNEIDESQRGLTATYTIYSKERKVNEAVDEFVSNIFF